MVGIIIAVVLVVLAVVILLSYYLKDTKFDRVFRKSHKETEVVKTETKQPEKEEPKQEVVVEKKVEVKKESEAEIKQVDIEKLKQEIYEEALEKLNPIIEQKVKEANKGNKNKTLTQQIKDLSPEMKAIVFTDIIKPKF